MRHFADWIRERHPEFIAARSQQLMRFGKYRGKSYEEVFMLDPSYCENVVQSSSQPESGLGKRQLADWIRERHPDFVAGMAQDVITFGKYQGKSYEEVFMLDKSFCEWTLKSSRPGLPSHRFAEWIRQRHPDFVAATAQVQKVMTCGKYYGKSFEEIFMLDQTYCGNVLKTSRQPESRLGIRQFADWIREQRPDFAATVQETMTLGKYQGKSYEDIFAHDPSFCEWTLDFSHPGSQMRHFADWIRERHPEFIAARSQQLMRFGKYRGKSYEGGLHARPVLL